MYRSRAASTGWPPVVCRARDRSRAPDQALPPRDRGRRPQLQHPARTDHRLPRPERRGQDDDPARFAGARAAHQRTSDGRRTPLSRARRPAADRRLGARGLELPPGAQRPQSPARARDGGRDLPFAGGRCARRGGAFRSGQATGGRLLAGDAPAAERGCRAARRARAARAGRARQRARPRGDSVAEELPPLLCGGRRNRVRVEPCARRDLAACRRGLDHPPRQARGAAAGRGADRPRGRRHAGAFAAGG